jgi:hypothetical protein
MHACLKWHHSAKEEVPNASHQEEQETQPTKFAQQSAQGPSSTTLSAGITKS